MYHARTFNPVQNQPSINMAQNEIDPNNNLGVQRFSQLDIPTKYQNLATTILRPTCKCFETIIDVDY